MTRAFKLPDLGEGIHEGEVLAVLVSVGHEVKEGDPILEVETDKAAVEIPSPFTGTVKEIMVKPTPLYKRPQLLSLPKLLLKSYNFYRKYNFYHFKKAIDIL